MGNQHINFGTNGTDRMRVASYGNVQLNVYDKNGKIITTLTDANQSAGRYSVTWNANGIPSGVYNYALYVDGELLVKRALKLKD